MKKLLFLFAGLLFMAISAESVKAQATATANAAATIVTPISIEKTVDLNFGAIVPSATAGTVIVGSDNSITPYDGVTLISQLGTHSAASFTVTGAPNATFTVTLPSSLSLDGPSEESMTVSDFTSNATGALDVSGTEDFSVGATLAVDANQLPGLYEGQFDVTVTYE